MKLTGKYADYKPDFTAQKENNAIFITKDTEYLMDDSITDVVLGLSKCSESPYQYAKSFHYFDRHPEMEKYATRINALKIWEIICAMDESSIYDYETLQSDFGCDIPKEELFEEIDCFIADILEKKIDPDRFKIGFNIERFCHNIHYFERIRENK